jgi:hypothetical protein
MESIETRSIKESAETKNIPAAKRLEEAGWKPAYCPRPQKKETSPRKQIAKEVPSLPSFVILARCVKIKTLL